MATIPIVPDEPPIDPDTNDFADAWKDLFKLLTQALRRGVGNEGYEISQQTAANIAIIEPIAAKGTLIFNTDEINGGTMDAPNGQLFIKLGDGTFHAIPNS